MWINKQCNQRNTQKVIIPTQESRERVASKESVEPEPLRGKVFTTRRTVRRAIQVEQTIEAKVQHVKRPSAFTNSMDYSFISAFIQQIFIVHISIPSIVLNLGNKNKLTIHCWRIHSLNKGK